MREQLARLGMGLEDRLKAGVNKLSGGQRQAMSLLMATIAEPSLLLLDEHTAALDPKVAATIMDLTGEIVAERDLTTLMVTHNMELALRYGDRLIMMHAGRIVLDLDQRAEAHAQRPRPHREVPRGRRRGVRRRPHAARTLRWRLVCPIAPERGTLVHMWGACHAYVQGNAAASLRLPCRLARRCVLLARVVAAASGPAPAPAAAATAPRPQVAALVERDHGPRDRQDPAGPRTRIAGCSRPRAPRS